MNTTNRLQEIRDKYNLPALAVLVVKDGVTVERAAVGIRKWGETNAVTTNDLFHIGSCTKSMTATLSAMLVEDGKLNWTTRIIDVFPEFKGKIDERYEAVTMEQLLMHRSGLPGHPPEAAWSRAWEQHGTPVQQRYEFIQAVLREKPEADPGTKYIYSNQGYAIAGAMLEKLANKPWEDLIRERLFDPLHMQSAGFGPPYTKERPNQPWGHKKNADGTLIPTNIDNPPAIAPAGRVHCSLDDLSRFLMSHLEPDKAGLLKPETIRKLHTPPSGAEYAFGWGVMKSRRGTALTHAGSNTMWLVDMWLLPDKKLIIISATNIGGSAAGKACNDAVAMMMQKWNP
jgi:CubicO group peptidase (beta-lactamase class C family)